MRTRRIKRKGKGKQKRKGPTRKQKGGFMDYPSFYIKNALSMFTLTPPVAYGNTSKVNPNPYFQPK